jgi:hypothetical protein
MEGRKKVSSPLLRRASKSQENFPQNVLFKPSGTRNEAFLQKLKAFFALGETCGNDVDLDEGSFRFLES